jgi:hypothetical protein
MFFSFVDRTISALNKKPTCFQGRFRYLLPNQFAEVRRSDQLTDWIIASCKNE